MPVPEGISFHQLLNLSKLCFQEVFFIKHPESFPVPLNGHRSVVRLFVRHDSAFALRGIQSPVSELFDSVRSTNSADKESSLMVKLLSLRQNQISVFLIFLPMTFSGCFIRPDRFRGS